MKTIIIYMERRALHAGDLQTVLADREYWASECIGYEGAFYLITTFREEEVLDAYHDAVGKTEPPKAAI